MQSFSKTTKLELLSPNGKVSAEFFYALFLSCGSYDKDGNFEITTELPQLFEFCNKNLKSLEKLFSLQNYDNEDICQCLELKFNNKIYYKIKLKYNTLNLLFQKVGLNINTNLEANLLNISKNINSIKNFTKGMFIGCGTSSIKISQKPNEKTSSGYHLEFTSKNLSLLREFSHILAQFEIMPKLIFRKNLYVLYLKDAEQICNILALIGANNSVLLLQNEIVKREFRNKINRQTNCLSANISKTVEASIKQLNAIKKIDESIGLSKLPADLEEVALLRLANPEEPLTSLLLLSNIKLTKSGLNHRLSKIISIAEKL